MLCASNTPRTHLLKSVYLVDLVQCIHGGGQPRVRAEQLVLNDSCQRQVIEQVGQDLPHTCAAVLPQALLIEAVDLIEGVCTLYM